MLYLALLFFILSLTAGYAGSAGVGNPALARALVFVFLALLIASAIAAAIRGRPPL
jgi:uncharacterized membrane protein YtjA (UPF0391 family)